MKNKIELAAKWEEKTYSCTLPYPDAAAAEVKGVASCPYCATKPFLAGGRSLGLNDGDPVESDPLPTIEEAVMSLVELTRRAFAPVFLLSDAVPVRR